MHHSRMTQWETWSHTIYTQGPSLLSISNYFPTGLTHQSETFLWVYFPDDFSEAAAFFFSGPQPFTWLETRKASVRAKSKSVDEGCLLLRLSPLVIDVSPVLLPRHCQTGSIVCVCSSNCRLFWSNKSIFHTASTLTQSLIWWRIFLSLLQNGRYI